MHDDTRSERVIKHCEFILSNVDQDIADDYRAYGHGLYNPDTPLLIQFSRNLRMLCHSAIGINSVRNINDTNKGNDNSGDNQD
jgi:hypothetical protein